MGDRKGKAKAKGKAVENMANRREETWFLPLLVHPHCFPHSFTQHIEEMGGQNFVFVIEKKLYFLDVNHQAIQLSILLSQIQSHAFLTESEAKLLEGNNDVRANLLEPSMVETELNTSQHPLMEILGTTSFFHYRGNVLPG
ncbi:hypothetical protein GQ457_02G023340 [Hibiscus cannabinus]